MRVVLTFKMFFTCEINTPSINVMQKHLSFGKCCYVLLCTLSTPTSIARLNQHPATFEPHRRNINQKLYRITIIRYYYVLVGRSHPIIRGGGPDHPLSHNKLWGSWHPGEGEKVWQAEGRSDESCPVPCYTVQLM